ncbi:unnamed protein product [Gongylonema pulchrum]|uniref:DUF4899 domain-containing protein n=1 Tax=Gongylonema pulchrum TaxID=637853 RepID=A0A183DPG7_9BILA|nr:unnamed protein product [Gongylonema pulchrum]
MIESVGTKFFKSITETADELGGRFEIAFTNFSDKITDDADALVVEFISLSNLIKVVLLILIVLLLLIIFKYLALGTLYLRTRWLKRNVQPSKTQFFILAVPIKMDRPKKEIGTFKKRYDNVEAAFQLHTAQDGQFLLKPLDKAQTFETTEFASSRGD